jgi:predicted anti-sigma-YlaC factor YlaD
MFGHRSKPQHGEPPGTVTFMPCQVWREAISALIDGEHSPVPDAATEIHLARCRECRGFRDDAVLLTRQMRAQALVVVAPRPPALLSRLGCRGHPSAAGRPWASLSRFPWSRATQWAIGAVPLGFAVPALLLGAFAHVHIVPSHVLSPCTMGLHHAHPAWRKFNSGK